MRDRDLALLCACVALIFSDQNLLAPNLTQAATSLGLDAQQRDEQLGGGLAAGLFIVGGPAALLVGGAADGAMRRVDLLAIVLGVGACGCLLSALSPTYNWLFVSRVRATLSAPRLPPPPVGGRRMRSYSLQFAFASPACAPPTPPAPPAMPSAFS